jgi:hypothetical protein
MPAAALAATPAAPHTQPHHAATGARTRDGWHTVKVPLRLVVGAQYPDGALSAYVKIAALALRPEGCTARVSTLAAYLGMSKSAVERGLRPLTQPDPVDGLVEVPTVRRTKSGGTGESAHRVTRPLTRDELWVRIPVRAAETLTPRLLRLYALLAYATARRIPVTAAELGEMLRHHTGKSAGEYLGERQARRLVDELATTGWLTVRRREGEQGRHAYETNRRPLHTVPAPAATATSSAQAEALEVPPVQQGSGAPVIHDGSGADLGDGSLAYREDRVTDRQEKTQQGGGIRRRRPTGSKPAASADSRPQGQVPGTFGPGHGVLRTDAPAPGSAVCGPKLSSEEWARIWAVLAPVAHTLTDLSHWEWARVVSEIHHQLTTGTTTDRLTDRVARRYASTETIRSTSRWLLGVALVRNGCADPRCETGIIWAAGPDDHEAGHDCRTCAYTREAEAAQAQQLHELEESERRVAARRGELMREAEELARRQRRAVGRERAELLEELAADGRTLPASAVFGTPRPGPELPPARPLPAKASYRERERAPEWEIRAAIRTLGPAPALHVYGALRVLPLLDQDEQPTIASAAPEPAGPVVGPGYAYVPGQVRAALGSRRALPGGLSAACPVPTCQAAPGTACTTPRGRRRTDVHQARSDATVSSAAASSVEEI